ncbi:MAG TPA: histidine kinase N-terminal 7TM domain-containing protein [Anaerolineales bacterium]|nr:histidine kinase N-terminal 7TM domain-containing protein [Anaerolineales bacterium]
MLSGWLQDLLTGIITFNQILTAGIAITAFSLFLYALSFNLRDRVARSFAVILLCVVTVFTSEALESSSTSPQFIDLLLRLEWFGIVFLPPAYLHLSDAILVTTGRPSRGRRRLVVRLMYAVSAIFLLLLASGRLLGPIEMAGQPAPHLQRTIWTEIFTGYYIAIMVLAWINFGRAYRRTLTRSGRRRMVYLLAGATAPALGSFPYLLYGSKLAGSFPFLFWGLATVSNLLVGVLIIIMAYAVAFFGVSWPDRVVRSRLFKWIMRGPVVASVALAVMTLVRRGGEFFGATYSAAVPAAMVATVLLFEHVITLVSPLWDRLIFFGRDRTDLALLQTLEDRLITQNDMRQFLEAVLAAVRDHLQSPAAFVAALDGGDLSLVVTTGSMLQVKESNLSEALQTVSSESNGDGEEYIWGDYWLFPLHQAPDTVDGSPVLLGLLGVLRHPDQTILKDQRQALLVLLNRATVALRDRRLQQSVFRSLEDLRPQVDMFQRMRAVGRYDSKASLLEETMPPESDMAEWVRDALTHYWGGPKLTQNPLLNLQIVQEAFKEHNDNPANALRSILRQAMDNVRPEGERRFTGEWILFNILEMKFVEGRKVREVASRLAMSEADLYRKQRVAIEEVARVILEMERQTQVRINGKVTGD